MKNLFGSLCYIIGLGATVILLAGCNAFEVPTDFVPTATPLTPSGVSEPTEDTYISGENFCKEYAGLKEPEVGKWIAVPKDYSDPAKGEILIYAWTAFHFDPSLPSFVIVDGGPGQNTHGIRTFLNENDRAWNEIHFDQRGLGCSAAQSFAEYRDVSLYSTENTIRDMDEIRKSYEIESWSVYGVSYGTVPATRYANLFAESTKAIVLEGVVYDSKNIHAADWYAEKLNLVLEELRESQRERFHLLMADSAYSDVLNFWMQIHARSTLENQYAQLASDLKEYLSNDLRAIKKSLTALKSKLNESAAKAPDHQTQKPMGIDYHVHRVIYCKELNGKDDLPSAVYSIEERRYVRGLADNELSQQDCLDRGVTEDLEQEYVAADYPVSVPVTYFQGTHDNATLARGALLHWQSVPKAMVQLLLNQKGGHNPMLADLNGSEEQNIPKLPEIQKVLAKALLAVELFEDDLTSLNQKSPALQKWLLFKEPPTDMGLVSGQLNGISIILK